MAEINRLLKKLRIDKTNLSQLELVDAFKKQGLTISNSTLSRAESFSEPSYKTLSAYSNFFNIPMKEFTSVLEQTKTADQVLKEYNDSQDDKFINNDFEMINIQNLINQIDVLTVPYFESISAGNEMELIEDYPVELMQVSVPKNSYSKKDNLIAVKVNGDSMNKIIPDKYIVILDKGGCPKNNDIIAYQIDGNSYGLKRLIETPNFLVLLPESYNPEYKPKTINIEDIPIREFNIIGKVIGVQADLKDINF